MPLRWTNFLVVKICPKHDCKNSRLSGQLTGVPKLANEREREREYPNWTMFELPVRYYPSDRSGPRSKNGGAHDGVHYGSASHSQGDRSLP